MSMNCLPINSYVCDDVYFIVVHVNLPDIYIERANTKGDSLLHTCHPLISVIHLYPLYNLL